MSAVEDLIRLTQDCMHEARDENKINELVHKAYTLGYQKAKEEEDKL